MDNRRLILLATAACIFIFMIGLTGFAFFYQPPGPGTARSDEESVPAINVAETMADATKVRLGGEFVHAVRHDVTSAQGFNPIWAADDTGQLVVNLLFPRLLGQDPMTGVIVPTELAERWEVSDDGRRYTFFLRDGVMWNDGTPVTAADFLFTYQALGRAELQSPFQSHTSLIESMQAPDAHTLMVTLHSPNCTALHNLRRPLLPSHRYAPDFSDLRDHALNDAPEVSAGPFQFEAHQPGAQIVLARNPNYWKGPPRLDRYVMRIVEDPAAQAALLAAGEIDLARLPVGDEFPGDEFPFAASEAVRLLWQPQPDYSFLALNLADPAQPVSGDIQPQPPHPILGDSAVRRALALAIDVEAMIAEILGGRAAGLNSYVLPAIPWAYDAGLAPIPFDPAHARQELDAAGWTAPNGGIRSRNGQPLALRLMTNEDNPQRVAMARQIQSYLAEIGVEVRLELMPFPAVTGELLGQRFDLVLVGWDNLLADPGLQPFWHSRNDVVDSGFNFTSFYDTEVDMWLDQALTLPGCDLAGRGARYAQVQQRIHAQMPYILLASELGGWALQNRWEGVAPGPWRLHDNVQVWQRAD